MIDHKVFLHIFDHTNIWFSMNICYHYIVKFIKRHLYYKNIQKLKKTNSNRIKIDKNNCLSLLNVYGIKTNAVDDETERV